MTEDYSKVKEVRPWEKGSVPFIKQKNSRLYEIIDDFAYYIRHLQKILVIHKGFVFDGSSHYLCGMIATGLIGGSFSGKYVTPAFLHDALYVSEIITRREADESFIDEMEKWEVSWWKRNLMWSAVRMGGWMVWNEHTEEEVKLAREMIKLISPA